VLDSVVILTPLLVLGVLLLLGYAGCTFDPSGTVGTGSDPFDLPGLYIVVSVPTALTVTEIEYRCLEPDGDRVELTDTNPTASYLEDGDEVFVHNCGDAVAGTWGVGCGVTVSEAGLTERRDADGTVILDGTDTYPKAKFQASGTPSGGDFDVNFVGFQET
jgi:hypothetical protein